MCTSLCRQCRFHIGNVILQDEVDPLSGDGRCIVDVQGDVSGQEIGQRVFLRQQLAPRPVEIPAPTQATQPDIAGLDDGIP